ncbi:MAG: hypothetical protein IPJ53_00395 [Saprospiraceae bacterium]|nr:hypothetical protein [Candidatus Vicinibacter affinis]
MKNIILHEPLTRVWQKWRFYAPQTHLWLIKVWFYASTFVVKIATFAKPETVSTHPKKPTRPTTNEQKIKDKMPTLRKIKRAASRYTSQRFCSTFNFTQPHPSPHTTLTTDKILITFYLEM